MPQLQNLWGGIFRKRLTSCKETPVRNTSASLMCAVYQRAAPKAQRLHATWQDGSLNWRASIKLLSCANEGSRFVERISPLPSCCSTFPPQSDFTTGICISFAGLCSPALGVLSASTKCDSACFCMQKRRKRSWERGLGWDCYRHNK